MQRKVRENGLAWEVDSAGTGSYHVGESPDPRSIAVAGGHGLDIRGQRSRQFTVADFDRFDLIFAMDASNYQNIRRLARSDNDRDKVELIMNMERPGWNQGVPDPYWGEGGFENVYQMLDRACDGVLKRYAD